MKKLYFFFIATLISLTIYAQVPPIEWKKCYGGTGGEMASSIEQTNDGGYIVAGKANSNDGDVTENNGDYDYWIVKLNSVGDITWEKSYGGTGIDEASSVQQTDDGGYIIAGSSRSNDIDVSGHNGILSWNNPDYWIVKLDDTGNLQWQKSLGGTSWDKANSISQTVDGGFIVAGQSYSNDGNVSGNHLDSSSNATADYWVVKLDDSGNIEWQKSLGGMGRDNATSIKQTTDGGYVVSGMSDSNDGDVSGNHGYEDYWVVKLSDIGNIQWQKSFGGTRYEECWVVNQTSDGGFIVAGDAQSDNGDVTVHYDDTVTTDIWVVKLDNAGVIEWQKSYGGSEYDLAYSMEQTNDGGYIIAGQTDSDDIDVTGSIYPRNYWILKITNVGAIEWQKKMGGTSLEVAYSVQQTTDEGYIVAGMSSSDTLDVSGNHGFQDYWVIKFAGTLGIEDVGNNTLQVYPNPAATEITVSGYSHAYLKLCDAVGQTVVESKGSKLYVGNLSQGLYVLQLFDSNGQQVKTEKVIVAR